MVRKLISLALSAATIGCAAQQPWSFNLGDFLAAKELPYDSPPQVIYHIDDHRFVTLEHYRDCNHGETFYNDTKAGIRSYLGRGTVENFQGRVINADPTGRNLVFPAATPPYTVCGNGERGCNPTMAYSTDGGRIFDGVVYSKNNFDPFEYSKDYTISVTKDKLYVAKKWGDDDAYVVEYPMMPNIDLSRPYPPGITGDSFAASKRPGFLSGIHTPSGQDHITCDASIRPTNPDAPLNQDRQ
ncbi:MAG: hypothetical protein AB1704_17655 [Pseudomonadota bacterium]|jgi:hypothetical protein|uniref:T6SS immunity protein Tli3 family protein n=1 Tax=Burkholderia sp. 4M9327F10 TaxID=2502223 RepID=UPI0010F98D5C|nr:hypothetical protein [Burkholderia sp. 4M9327F10]